jgi:hypothetical protein
LKFILVENKVELFLHAFVLFINSQPRVEKLFLGYLIPYTFAPMNIHNVTAKPDKVPAMAPLLFANGMNKPKQKRPKIGPPITLIKY